MMMSGGARPRERRVGCMHGAAENPEAGAVSSVFGMHGVRRPAAAWLMSDERALHACACTGADP
jgi:hypothetical protein